MAMPFTNLFAQFDRSDPSPRFQSLRKAARTQLQTMSVPTTRSEDWRFTNLGPLLEAPFELAAVRDLPTSQLPRDRQRLFFLNGRFAASSSMSLSGIQIGSLADAKTDVGLIGNIAQNQDNVFTALNSSLLADGAYVVLPDGKNIEMPIEIIYESDSRDGPIVSHPRTLLIAGRNTRATVVERFFGGGTYFTNAVTEISVGEGAIVNHVKIQDESITAYHIANTSVVMGAKSNFTTHYLSLGGSLMRNEVRVRFEGEHAEATVNGLYLANDKQHIDNFTVIDHAQPNCASHELYKGILDGKSHGVFNGKIFVRKDAQKTDAKQTNKVLLLSDDATINTKPQLEIFADDVKCTHGATVGQLDPVQLFYLQSRGIPLDQSRRLLTFAFANDIVNRLKIESLREELEARIVR